MSRGKTAQEIREKLDGIFEDLFKVTEKQIHDAKIEGFEQGLVANIKPPTDRQFRKDHKTPMSYGEDFAYVVYCRSKKTAAKLLECDEDSVDDISVGWGCYEDDGELKVGYKVGHGVEGIWTAWGIWL